LTSQQAFDAINVTGSFGDQFLAFPGQAPTIFLFRCRRPDHRTHPAFTPAPRHQRAHQTIQVETVGFAASGSPVDRDRGRIDDLADKAVGFQQTMKPEPVQTGLLNDPHRDPMTDPCFNLGPLLL
jgi:hypothetical protein